MARPLIALRPWLLASSVFASGCIPALVDLPVRDLRHDLPSKYGAAETGEGKGAGQRAWRDYFAEPELRALIDAALANNQELQIRLQEVAIARAEVSARRGEYKPRVAGRVSLGADKVGAFTSQGYSDDATGLSAILGDLSLGLVGSWELDVWGRLQNAATAADRRFLASVEARHFVVTQVVAEIARSFYELVALDNQIEVLRSNVELLSRSVEIVKAEKAAGRVTELAVQRFEAEYLKNASRLFDLQQERVQTENRINVLAGRYPTPVERRAELLQQKLPDQLTTGLPTELLDDRPDIRQAALELAAAKLDVQSVRKEFLPSLSLEAGLGYRAFNPAHLFVTPESLIANLFGNLVAPLVNRAGIEARYRSANARQIQAVFNYERAVLQGYTDVVNQLARYDNFSKKQELQEKQVEVLGRSVDVSGLLFQSARADYVEVLLTRRESLDARMELIETRKRLLLTTVDLYQALGGGWREADGT